MTAVVSTAPMEFRERRTAGLAVDREGFLKSYVNAVESLARTLDAFLATSDQRAVQEVRTVLSRFEAHVELLPGKIRKSPKVRRLLKKHRKLMKKSAKVADLYAIRAKVARCPQDYLAARLVKKVDERRRDRMKEMRDCVASARRISPPTVESRDLVLTKLESRFSKVTGELARTINTLLPDVATDPNLVTALGRLRAESARLRCILEFSHKGGSAKVLALMEDWQDGLQTLHDWDVAISCLQEFDSPIAEELVMSGVRERAKEFRSFARSILQTA